MTKTRSTKSALLSSVLALVLCFVMMLGTTFAWFTDSVTSSGNKIQAGTLKVDLSLKDKNTGAWNSLKENKDPIFTHLNFESGYVDTKLLKVENKGTLSLKWKAKLVASGDFTELADVIDVYVLAYGVLDDASNVTYPTSRDLVALGYTRVGTLAEFVSTLESTTNGTLNKNEAAYLGIALKMQETAGNYYQGMALGGTFDIQIVATQHTTESDSIDNGYDEGATLDYAPVSNVNELRAALANREENILLTADIVVDNGFTLDYDVNINGDGHTITRTDGTAVLAIDDEAPAIYTGTVFTVKAGTTATFENVIIDGGAIWTGEAHPVLLRGTVNAGVAATGALISTEGNGSIVLNEGAVLQNNDGANAVSLSTRAGSTLTLNGGQILNNHSAAGAIWGGGAITINDGKVNGNHGGLGGAIRVVTNIGTILTMNGGEMNHNLSDGVGGAIWAGASRSNNVYVLNGGEMAYNYSPVGGGAIYAGYYETVKIGGTFKMHDNDAPLAGAIRFHDHASFVMTGGEIYDNGDGSLFLYNNSTTITGGTISDNFSYAGGLGLTIGEADIEGVIHYNIGTNHKTAYLAESFNSFSFTVEEGHEATFNLKPAAGYTYVEGDEAKLVCVNEGYETYWDAAAGVFKLRVTN